MSESSKTRKIAARTFLALVLSLASVNVSAQESRKVIANPVPAYPETARRFRITGVVKVQIVIAPDGHVKETKIVGGHPLLVNAVEETLKSWKYAPASSESTTQLEFNFRP